MEAEEQPRTQQTSALWAARGRALEMAVRRLHPRSPARPEYYGKKFPPAPVETIAARLDLLAGLTGLKAPHVKAESDRIYRLIPG